MEDNPPARAIEVYLPEPLITALDAYGKEHGTGRGRSITALLKDVLTPCDNSAVLPPALPVAQKDMVRLELVKTTNPLYVAYRRSHYIPSRGVVGQQLQYLIFYGNEVVGVIGGASSVYTNEFRDEYFGLSQDKDLKTKQLNSIVNNNIFKLTYPAPNLASIVLSVFIKRIRKDWKTMYGIEVHGIESFVVEERLWSGKKRDGVCYRAANFELVGITKGTGSRNVRGRATNNKSLRAKKLVYCLKIKGKKLNTEEYKTSWGDTKQQAILDKKRKQTIADPLDVLLKTIQE